MWGWGRGLCSSGVQQLPHPASYPVPLVSQKQGLLWSDLLSVRVKSLLGIRRRCHLKDGGPSPGSLRGSMEAGEEKGWDGRRAEQERGIPTHRSQDSGQPKVPLWASVCSSVKWEVQKASAPVTTAH